MVASEILAVACEQLGLTDLLYRLTVSGWKSVEESVGSVSQRGEKDQDHKSPYGNG